MGIIENILKSMSIFIIIIILVGCDEDKGSITSNTMVIVVNSMNDSDINEQGIIEKDENISNDSGNPWGEFIKEAEAQLGKNPNNFEIVSASIQLSDMNGIDTFEDLINGKAAVRFLSTQGSDTDAVQVEIGHVTNPKGTSTIELTNLASASELNILKERLIGGDFHVGFVGETSLSSNDSFSLDIIIKFVVRVD